MDSLQPPEWGGESSPSGLAEEHYMGQGSGEHSGHSRKAACAHSGRH